MVACAEMVAELGQQGDSLVDLPYGELAAVARVDAQRAGAGVARRLAEIGFLPGERVQVMARVPGGDPIAVRIGTSTFALRRREASCIHVYRNPVSI